MVTLLLALCGHVSAQTGIVTSDLQQNLDNTKSAEGWFDDQNNFDMLNIGDSAGTPTPTLEYDPAVLQNIFSHYDFVGNDTTATGGAGTVYGEGIRETDPDNRGTGEQIGNVDENDATIEIWIRPETSADGNQVLWETGGGTGAGFGLSDSNLFFGTAQGGTSIINANLAAIDLGDGLGTRNLIDDSDEFIQVLGVISLSGNSTELFVNGVSVGTAAFGGTGNTDWDGGDGSAIGGRGEANFGGRGGGFNYDSDQYGSFAGDISVFRIYGNRTNNGQNINGALSTTEIIQNYQAVNPDDVIGDDPNGTWGSDGDWLGNSKPTIDENAYIIGDDIGAFAMTVQNTTEDVNNVLLGHDEFFGGSFGGFLTVTGASASLNIVNDLWMGSFGGPGVMSHNEGIVRIGRDLDFGPGENGVGGVYEQSGGSLIIGQSIYRRTTMSGGSAIGTAQADFILNGGALDFERGTVNSRQLGNLTHGANGTINFQIDSLDGPTVLQVDSAATVNNGSSFSVELDASPSTSDLTAATWNAGTDIWDGDGSKWSSGYTPDGQGAIGTGQSFDLIHAGAVGGDTTNLVNAGADPDWAFAVVSGTTVQAQRINTAADFGPVKAVITGAGSMASRNGDLRIANAADGPGAAALDVLADALLTVSNDLILGGGGDGVVTHGSPGSGLSATVSVGNDLAFGTGANTEGGVYNLFDGSLNVGGNVVEVDATVDTAVLNVDGGALNVAGNITVEDFGVGFNAMTTGNFTVAAGQELTARDDLFVGGEGNGSLTNAGGTITANDFEIGGNATSDGNSFSQSGGLTQINGRTSIGQAGDTDNNLFTLTGGEFRSTAGFFQGESGASQGNLTTVDGGTMVIQGGNLEVANDGDGDFNLVSGEVIMNSNNLIPTQAAGSDGIYTQTGGIFDMRGESGIVTTLDINFNNGNGTVDLQDGVMYVSRDIQLLSSTANNQTRTSNLTVSGGSLFIRDDINYRTNGNNAGVKNDNVTISGGAVIFGNADGMFSGADPENDIVFTATGSSRHNFTFTGGLLAGVDRFLDVADINNTGGTLVQTGGTLGVTNIANTEIEGDYQVLDGATIAAQFDALSTDAAIVIANTDIGGNTANFNPNATADLVSAGGTYNLDVSIVGSGSTAAGAARTFDGGTNNTWDTTAANWTGDVLPNAGGTTIGAGTVFTVIDSANALTGNPLNATVSGYSVSTSTDNTDLLITSTGGTSVGAVLAIIDGTAGPVQRATGLRIHQAPATPDEVDAAGIEVNTGGQLDVNNGSDIILGSGPTGAGNTGDITQNGGLVNVSGDIVFGDSPTSEGGTLDLFGGTMNVTGNLIESGPGVGNAQVHVDGGQLNVAGNTLLVQSFRVGNAAGSSGSFQLDGMRHLDNTGTLYVGNEGTGTFNFSSGSITIANGLAIGALTGGNGAMVIGGAPGDPRLLELTGGDVDIGLGGGTGSLVLVDGTIITNVSGVDIAVSATSSGTYQQDGGLLQSAGGNFETAASGKGVAIINGGTLSQDSNNIIVGQNSGAVATFILNGGVATTQNQLRIANRSGGHYIQNGGTMLVGTIMDMANDAAGISTALVTVRGGLLSVGDRANNVLVVGNENNAASMSTFRVTGGTVLTSFGTDVAGNGGGSSGHFIVGDGTGTSNPLVRVNTSRTNNTGQGNFEAGEVGRSIVDVNSGALFQESANFIVGQGGASVSSVNVSGGFLLVGFDGTTDPNNPGVVGTPDADMNFNNGIGVLTQTGGSVRISRNLNLTSGATSTGTVNIEAGSFQVDNNIDFRDGDATFMVTGGRVFVGNSILLNDGDGGNTGRFVVDGSGPTDIEVDGNFTMADGGGEQIELEFRIDDGGVTPITVLDVGNVGGADVTLDGVFLADFSSLSGGQTAQTLGDLLLIDNESFDLIIANGSMGLFDNVGEGGMVGPVFGDGTFYQVISTYNGGGDGNFNDLALIVVPEPAAPLTAALAGVFLLLHRRRRRI